MKEVWSLTCDTPGQKLLLLALADQERDDAGCWPSLSTLQKRCSMSRQGILNQIAILEKRGWISVDRGGGKSSVYRLTIPVHAVDYSPEKNHAFQPVHRVDQSTELTSPQNGQQAVHTVDQRQSIELTTPVHCVDSNPKEPKVEPKGVSLKNRLGWFPEILRTPEFKEAFEEWEDHCVGRGSPLTPGARRVILEKLQRVGEPRAIEVIEGSMAGNWKSLVFDFDAKRNGSSNGNSHTAHVENKPAPTPPRWVEFLDTLPKTATFNRDFKFAEDFVKKNFREWLKAAPVLPQ